MDDKTIRILITGDFCPINRVERLALAGDNASVFNDFIDVFRGNDLNITDLECPLTLAGSVRLKTGPYQKAHPDCVKILTYANIGLAAMANNHIMDYGTDGVQDTIEICNANGIRTMGVGSSEAGSIMPYVASIKSKKLAIFNFADNEFITTPDGKYRCSPIDPVRIFYELASIRDSFDFIIIILHAGNEFYELPSPRTKELYRYFVDNGADAVISNHTHAYSGYEIYQSKPIFYGLGNFIYDWPGKVNGKWNNGYTVRLLLSDEVRFELIPLKQGNERPGVFRLDADEMTAFRDNISRLNMIIADDMRLEAEFQKYCDSVNPMYDAFIEPYLGKRVASLRKRGLFPRLTSRRKRLLLLNIIRCESHRDVLTRMLKKYE